MDVNTRRDWQIRLAAVIIFALGFAAGALALNVYRGVADTSPGHDGREHFGAVLDELELSEEQREKVHAIFTEARAEMTAVREACGPKYREVRERTDTRLREVMTEEQWARFQSLTSEMRDRWHHGRGGHGSSHHGRDKEEPR